MRILALRLGESTRYVPSVRGRKSKTGLMTQAGRACVTTEGANYPQHFFGLQVSFFSASFFGAHVCFFSFTSFLEQQPMSLTSTRKLLGDQRHRSFLN